MKRSKFHCPTRAAAALLMVLGIDGCVDDPPSPSHYYSKYPAKGSVPDLSESESPEGEIQRTSPVYRNGDGRDERDRNGDERIRRDVGNANPWNLPNDPAEIERQIFDLETKKSLKLAAMGNVVQKYQNGEISAAERKKESDSLESQVSLLEKQIGELRQKIYDSRKISPEDSRRLLNSGGMRND